MSEGDVKPWTDDMLPEALWRAPVGVAFFDHEFRYLFTNPIMAGLSGLPPDAHLGRSVMEMLPATGQDMLRGLRQVMDTGAPVLGLEIAVPVPVTPGETRHWLVDYFPVWREGRLAYLGAAVMEITGHREAEKELHDFNRILSVLEGTGAAFLSVDRDWRIIYVNRTAEPLLRKTREQLLGRILWDEFPEAKGTIYWREYHRAFEENVSVKFEAHYLPLDLWTEVRAHPSPQGLGVFFLDITARKKSEQALQAQEARLRSLVEAVSQVVWVANERGEAAEDILSWRAFTGQTFEEFIGRGWLDAIHPEDRERAALAWEDAVARQGFYEVEYRLRRPDGSYTPVISRGAPVRDPDGRLREWVGACTDITETRRAEQALRVSEQRYRSLVEATSEIVWVTPPSGEFISEQPGWSAFTGQNFEQLKGWGWLDAIHPEDRLHTVRVWSEALVSRSTYQIEHRMRRHDGVYHHMQVRAVPVLNDDGSIREWVGIHRDISEQRRLDAERVRALGEAQEAIRLRDEFLSVASHELKTPLTPLQLKLQFLRRAAQAAPGGQLSSEWVLREVKAALTQVSKLSALISDLLDVSRITSGRLFLAPQPMDLGEVVREVVSSLGAQAARDGGLIHMETCAPLVGQWDRQRLEQVVDNLLSNAIKYGAGKPIQVRVFRDGTNAQLTIRDHGIGIAPKDLERIFGRFERAVSERHYGGLGLGLYITRQIVEAHGGSVQVESTPGQGSTFTVTLPLEPVAPVQS